MFEFTVSPILLILVIGLWLVAIIGMWKVFEKAGKPGWASLVPIYNIIVLLEIAGRPVWWFLLILIPLVNIAIGAIVSIDVAKSFGKDVGFGIGLMLVPIVMYPVLGFGKDEYIGPSATG